MNASPVDRQSAVKCLNLVLQLLCLVAATARPALAQTPSLRTILAEGAANEFFTEEILIGNPNASAATVQITLLPENGAAPPVQTITVAPTSRYTFRVNSVVDSGAVGAIVDSNIPVVVERSMYWSYGLRRGGHNSQGVAAPASQWYLAEGTVGFFDTFILITNSSATPAQVEVTFLREVGGPFTTPFTIPANGRKTIYVNADFPQIQTQFSTIVRQTNTPASIVVERAMYWNAFEGGHESTAVTAPNQTWLFAEGATGGDASFDFQTYLLLANPNASAADVTIDFFRDAGGPVQYQLEVAPNSRKTLFLDDLPFANGVKELANAAFSIRVTSSLPLLAERSLYWSSSGIAFIDGHNTPGVNAEASKWAFAEGREGRFIDSGPISYDSYFLFANSSASTLRIKGTFVREDGLGIVHYFTMNPTSRFTLLSSQFLELSNQRFSAFFEAVDANGAATTQTFVAERAMYWGPGYFGGHGSTGTPWPNNVTIVAPPIIDLTPTIDSVSPTHGPLTGGTPVTITGTNFVESTAVEFGDRPATSIQRVNATQMIATAPAGVALGPVSVKVMNPGKPAATRANAYTYDAVVPYITTDFTLAFGDSLTAGVTWTMCNVGGTMMPCSPPPDSNFGYPGRLRALLQARYPAQQIQVQAAGVPGECASETDCVPSAPNSGENRLPATISSAQDLVVILQGVNDLNGQISIGTIIGALRSMIVSARNAGKQVIICTLPPVKAHEITGIYKADPARIAALNAAIESLKNEFSPAIPRVDMTAAFGPGYASLLSLDGLHPNGSGYQRMAEAIRDKIVERFEVRP